MTNATHVGSDAPLSREEVEHLLHNPILLNSDGILHRRFPRLAVPVRLQDFPMTVRVQKCIEKLHKQHNLESLADINRFTIGHLMGLKNFGRKSMIDLLSSVRVVVTDANVGASTDGRPLSPIVTAAAQRLRAQYYASRVRCTDPRLGADACALLAVANTCSRESDLPPSAFIQAVAHRLVGRTRDSSPEELVLGAIRGIRSKVARARRLTLEKELEEITNLFMKGKNAGVVSSFFGWSAEGPKTLQAAGDEFHITRERVRQITAKFAKKVRAARPYVPTLRRAIEFIARRVPASADQIELDLKSSGFTRSRVRPDGIIAAAELFGISTSFMVEEHQGARTVVRHEDTGLARRVLRLARKVVSHAGLGKIADLADLLGEESGIFLESSILKGIIHSIDTLLWLDDEREWFLLADTPRNHLITLATKILSVAPRIHVNEMRGAIASDYRGMGFSPPRSVVLEFCKSACDCEIDGDIIVARHPRPTAEVLSELEQVAWAVLREEGTPLLHRSQFERLCLKRGMNQSTFANYVGRLSILERFAPGVYGLRGAPMVPGDVERCIPRFEKRVRDHGWTSDAKPWLLLELSAAAISSGVITVPAAFSPFVQGSYLIHTQDGSTMGTLVASRNSAWGLRPVFTRRGGEPGDFVFLTFDTQLHEVAVRLGTKEDIFGDDGDGAS
jgi:hypothetical protein